MVEEIRVDLKENRILALDSTLLSIMLKDNSSGKNIIWATDDYTQYDETYTRDRQITIFSVTGKYGNIIKPRTEKSKQEQLARVRDKAEVFTPSWICNKQNNLVDSAWFGRENVFNVEHEKTRTVDKCDTGKCKRFFERKVGYLEVSCKLVLIDAEPKCFVTTDHFVMKKDVKKIKTIRRKKLSTDSSFFCRLDY